MPTDRELTATYVILGQAHVAACPYDAKGAFILLHSITAGLGEATPDIVDMASHVHMIAALGGGEVAAQTARLSMTRLISVLEHRLKAGVSA